MAVSPRPFTFFVGTKARSDGDESTNSSIRVKQFTPYGSTSIMPIKAKSAVNTMMSNRTKPPV